MNKLSPFVIYGKKYKDERGELQFFNNFDLSKIKRIYFTTHPKTEVIRAWQGHTIQSRWFSAVHGSFVVKLIKIDNWEKPSHDLKVLEYTLNEEKQEILYIPKGYVNGFKALKKNSKLMIMSDYGFSEIENDEIRFDKNKWSKWHN